METLELNAVDLFAGCGGWSHGWREATGREPLVAVNHDDHAIFLHTQNHPSTEHWPRDVWELDPRDAIRGRRVDWLHLSPDCTHFSRAKGGRPREQKIRALAWVGIDWVKAARPRMFSLENVPEFTSWGPLDAAGQIVKAKSGETFGEFVAALRGLGYAAEWRVLCSADFGVPTIRKRLFMVARNDGLPIRWPEPTHGPGRPLPYRAAAECIDWTLPCPSIFGRKKPLAKATCRRIAAGLVRYVLNGEPFLVETAHGDFDTRNGRRIRGLSEPYGVVTTSNNHALVAASLLSNSTNNAPQSCERPLGTVTTGGRHGLVAAFLQQNYTGMIGKSLRVPVPAVTAIDHNSLVAASLIQSGYGERQGQAPRSLDIRQPLGTIVAGGSKHALVAAFLTTYYSQGGTANRVNTPMPAVVTKARHGLVTATIEGADYIVADIGLRMLQPRELARAQGFPDSYILEGTKTQQIARIGNSVTPGLVTALVRANLDSTVRLAV